MRAKGRPALCRTWLRTEQSRPCHTTSSSSTSNSKFPNNIHWDCGDGGTLKRVCLCMLKKSEADWRTLLLWRFTSLRKRSPANMTYLSNQDLYGERERTDSDAYLAPFSVLNQHIRRRKRSHYMMVVLSKLWLCQRLNESVFILIEEFYITEVSFTCSPGKRMFQVFVFFLSRKHSRLYSNNSAICTCIF